MKLERKELDKLFKEKYHFFILITSEDINGPGWRC